MGSVVRLAYGVVAGRDLGVWAAGPDGVPVDASRATAGTPVVVGPRRTGADDLAAAVDGLRELVASGGAVAAGAGVAVGPDEAGLRTARLEGTGGDRRDAVLAALAVVGPAGGHRLGDRAALLVALFGPAATKPVGAAATAALHDGRLAALHLASAASDVLGPEQLERVLRLSGPDGLMAQAPGLASVLANHLDRVLGPLAKPRRLTVLLSLWDVVAARWAATEQRKRRLAFGSADDWQAGLRQRYQQLVDQDVLDTFGQGGRVSQVARWVPGMTTWTQWLNRTAHDAWAATLLARIALAVSDDGLEAGLAGFREPLARSSILLTRKDRRRATTRVAGLADIPARPGVYVRDLAELVHSKQQFDSRAAARVQPILARARDYATITLEAAQELLAALYAAYPRDVNFWWNCTHTRPWRAIVGYTDQRPPQSWEQLTVFNEGPSLAQRLREQPDANPADAECSADLLWLAELADVVAQFAGHDAAAVVHNEWILDIDTNPPAPAPEPLRPPDESIALAMAGAAQLIELGAELPARPRSWTELVEALMASTVVAESLTGAFLVPARLIGREGTTVPGTDVTLQIARDTHHLAEWAAYMGNCIAGPYYVSAAKKGRSVLCALRGPDGRVVANLELCPHRNRWKINEFKARFNNDPDVELEQRVTAWVASLPMDRPTRPAVESRAHGHTSIHRPQRRTQVVADLRTALVPVLHEALASDDVAAAVAVLNRAGSGTDGDIASLSALRRARRADIEAALRTALTDGDLDLLTLWRATALRPLATAVGGLDPELRDRHAFLHLLLADGPMHASPRRLARVPAIGHARTVELVARRLRRAVGRLARSADPLLTEQVPRHADPNLLCALVLAVSTAPTAPDAALVLIAAAGQPNVPGYPPSTLDDDDGPWRRAAADAIELGAELPPDGSPPGRPVPLRLPRDWLGRGGWPALWARVHRATTRSAR